MEEAVRGGRLLGDSTYVYLKRNVDAVTYRQIRALDIHGIEWEAVYQRSYPNGNVAAPLIGTVNAEGQGSSGLESRFDDLLTGRPGEEAFETAPNGAIMPGGKRTTVEPVNGGSLQTTIHADLQHQIQDMLDARVSRHQAEWGTVVIEDISTGQILVMADSNSAPPDNAKPQTVAGVQYAIRDKRVPRLNLSYRYRPGGRKLFNAGVRYQSKEYAQWDTSLAWPIAANWTALGRINYSFLKKDLTTGQLVDVKPGLVEGLLGVEYARDCWAVRVVAHRFVTTTRQTSTVGYVQFDLRGLGHFGQDPFGILTRNIPGYSLPDNNLAPAVRYYGYE